MAGPVQVLYVEDEEELQELVADYFDRKGISMELETATNGAEAVEMVDEHTIDCVISDFNMPEMNGVEMYASLRERGYTVPVVFYTSSDTVSERVADRDLEPPERVLAKRPDTLDDLTAAVKDVIEAPEIRN
jgi:CheY-like chemotaxis protein